MFTKKEIEDLNAIKDRAHKDAARLDAIERRLNNRSEKLFGVDDDTADKLDDIAGECGQIAGQLRYRVASEIWPLILASKKP